MSTDSQTLLITPWNPNNRFITRKDIHTIFDTMGIASKIPIHNVSLY